MKISARQAGWLRRAGLPSDQVSNDEDELPYVEGLCQMRLVAGDERPLSIFCSRERGQGYRGNLFPQGLLGAQAPHQLITIHPWHAKVADEDRGLRCPQPGQRILR